MNQTPVIVKKVRGAGHKKHGGAWKVAYADFVTAMMAFFLLLWLLNAATREQLEGISDYFSPITTRPATSGGGGLLAGEVAAEKGTYEMDIAEAKPMEPPRPSRCCATIRKRPATAASRSFCFADRRACASARLQIVHRSWLVLNVSQG